MQHQPAVCLLCLPQAAAAIPLLIENSPFCCPCVSPPSNGVASVSWEQIATSCGLGHFSLHCYVPSDLGLEKPSFQDTPARSRSPKPAMCGTYLLSQHFGRLRQEDLEFESSLGNLLRPCLKKGGGGWECCTVQTKDLSLIPSTKNSVLATLELNQFLALGFFVFPGTEA